VWHSGGIEASELWINQNKYIESILAEYAMTDCVHAYGFGIRLGSLD